MGNEGVTQTLFAGRDDGVPGDCLRAAVASLFSLPLEMVPHFVLFQDWEAALSIWLDQYGRHQQLRRVQTTVIPDERCLVYGKSPRGISHVVVGEHGAVAWDPHPSRAGLIAVAEVWLFEPEQLAAKPCRSVSYSSTHGRAHDLEALSKNSDCFSRRAGGVA